MKRKTMIAAAILAVAFAACEKENATRHDPVPATNPLIGTTWVYSFDTTMMYGNLHMEDRITFINDSIGKNVQIIEYAFQSEETYAITYTFYPEVNGIEYYIGDGHIPSYLRYHPESNTLTSKDMVYHKIEQ